MTQQIGKAMRRNRRWTIATALFLAVIVLAALFIRLWGTSFGLPAYTRYHPDEHALVDRAAAILWTGDWNLHRFNYPPFYAYLQALAYAAYFLYGAAQGWWNEILPYTLPQYYQIGRILTALMGTVTVFVVFLAGRQLRGRRLGLLAAALMAGCYLHIIHSHYATFDVMVGLLALLTYFFSDRIYTTGETKWYVLAGLAAGLAGATKYNGAVAIVIPIIAHIMATPWGEWGWLSGRLFASLGAFLLGFFGGNPFALGSLPDFLNGLATVLHHYGTAQPGFEGSGNWRWYVSVLLTSADVLWVVGGAAGMVLLISQRRKRGLLLLAFPIVYLLLISRFTVRFERNLVAVLPFLALGGGWLLDEGADWLSERLARGKGTSNLVALLGLTALVLLPVLAGILFDITISKTDLREIAGAWVDDNVAPGSQVAVEHYSVPIDQSEFQVHDVMRISDHDMGWYKQEGFDTLIISDGVWELLLREPQAYAERVGVYQQILAQGDLLAEFFPEAPGIVTAGYPTVGLYHLAPVRVIAVPR